jgi:hypothetical protein
MRFFLGVRSGTIIAVLKTHQSAGVGHLLSESRLLKELFSNLTLQGDIANCDQHVENIFAYSGEAVREFCEKYFHSSPSLTTIRTQERLK